jgi:hypothetical protein
MAELEIVLMNGPPFVDLAADGNRLCSCAAVEQQVHELVTEPVGLKTGCMLGQPMLDRLCTEIGRDPASITWSIILPVSYEHSGNTRDAIAKAIDAGFPHIILSLPSARCRAP